MAAANIRGGKAGALLARPFDATPAVR